MVWCQLRVRRGRSTALLLAVAVAVTGFTVLTGATRTSRLGGITLAQWSTVLALPGVSVAAPVAMIGYVAATAQASVDVTDTLDPSLSEQVVRLLPTWTAVVVIGASAATTGATLVPALLLGRTSAAALLAEE